MGPDAMKGYRFAANAVDEEQVNSEVALSEAGPINTALVEPMLSKPLR